MIELLIANLPVPIELTTTQEPEIVIAQSLQVTNENSKVDAEATPPELQNKPDPPPSEIPQEIIVERFEVVGSSVFTPEELATITQPYQNRPLSLSELFQVRSDVTKLYTEKGYLSSGAYIPPQALQNGILTIQVIEGELEAINVSGTERLTSGYVRSRLSAATDTPLNANELLEALQLLRLDSLIENVSAELEEGIRPGTSILNVQIEEADPFFLSTQFDNGRTPSVGSNRGRAGISHGNFLGFGDRLELGYTNTEGSDDLDVAYSVPVNAQEGRVSFAFGAGDNEVVEEPFNPLDIQSESRYYNLSFRQPIIREPGQELALGIAFSRQESETFVLDTPFALSRGANDEGETRISAFRLFQEWVDRGDEEVFAVRSQFSVGVGLFEATDNEDEPDSHFFAWRGQAQWIRRLDEDFLLILRGDLQLTPTGLVPLEQFRLGGIDSVRGYRQDLLLGDNGVFAGAEVRIPLFRIQPIDGVVQLTPFIDLGTVWNSDEVEIDQDFLSAVGIGLNFSAGNSFNARLDWGIPLNDIDNQGDSLQEDGIHFSINYNFL